MTYLLIRNIMATWYANCFNTCIKEKHAANSMIRKILIVDDEQTIRAGLSKFISRFCDFCGDVHTAGTGKEALYAIGTSFYDMCFLDICLPDINGIRLMEEINIVCPGTKIAVMTAGAVTDEMMGKINKGSSLFITKPLDLETVRTFVNEEFDIRSKLEDSSVSDINEDEKRNYRRTHCRKIIQYSVSVFYNWELKSDLEADIIDLSKSGAGIMTCYPLYPGNILRFNTVLENTSGIVKWSRRHGKSFRAGIKFL